MNSDASPARAEARLEGDVLEVRLSGDWRIVEERPQWVRLLGDAKPSRVRLTGSELGFWDSSLPIFMQEVREWARGAGVAVDLEHLPAGAMRLAAHLSIEPEREVAKHPALLGPFTAVGLASAGLWRDVKDSAQLVGECAYTIGRFFRGRAQFRWRDTLAEIQACGAMALPIVGLISFLVGVTMAYTGSLVVRQYGGDIWLADMVGLAVVREMGPMMAAVVLAGRTGAAFAATLGNMKANEEIDALQTLGVSPVDFLVMPRVVALFCMMPLLALYSDGVGMLGGMAIAYAPPMHIPTSLYWAETKSIVDLSDVNTGLLKASAFGLIIGLSGCLRGLQADRDAAGVGTAATRAVVTSILLIVVSDAVFAVIFNILGW
ncbi:MAG TPA: ABC transporter permease [Candidatus Didemnitutus sp.]|jgi:phospholipid/cholesterol/gamma-HCH transport system permease protein